MRLAFFILILLVAGCRTVKPTHTETVREFYRDTVIEIKGATTSVTLDSNTLSYIQNRLAAAFAKGEKDTVKYNDPTGKATLKFYKDPSGRLVVDCQSADQKFNLLLKEIEILKQIVNTKERSGISALGWGWVWIVFAGLVVTIIIKIICK